MGGCSSSHDSTLTTRYLQNLDQAREGWGNRLTTQPYSLGELSTTLSKESSRSPKPQRPPPSCQASCGSGLSVGDPMRTPVNLPASKTEWRGTPHRVPSGT